MTDNRDADKKIIGSLKVHRDQQQAEIEALDEPDPYEDLIEAGGLPEAQALDANALCPGGIEKGD